MLNAVGSTLAVQEPDAPAMLAAWPPLPADLRPPVAATNEAGYGYAVDDDTSPSNLALVHMHVGALAAAGDPRPWADGELGTTYDHLDPRSAVPARNAFVKTVIPFLRRARQPLTDRRLAGRGRARMSKTL